MSEQEKDKRDEVVELKELKEEIKNSQEIIIESSTLKPNKFSVTKLDEEAINESKTLKTLRVRIADDAKNDDDNDDEDDENDTLLNESQAFANRKHHRFKTQKSIFDPFPHFDNYSNTLTKEATEELNAQIKAHTSSDMNSSSKLDDAIGSDQQYENTITTNNDTIVKAEGISARPTLRELQTSAGRASGREKRHKRGRLMSLSRMSFHSKKNKNNISSRQQDQTDEEKGDKKRKKQEPNKSNIIKFGWIEGVLIRCVLNIFGIMIFLRMTWIVGQAGLIHATIIIATATVVTLITSLSTSAISTNGEIKGGGAYYLISRSLGPEFGGAIGLVFSFANAVASAMYVIGFSETLVYSVFGKYGIQIFDGAINDVRIVGVISVVILIFIALIGMKWEAKVQVFLLLILLTAFMDFFIGAALKPNQTQRDKGFIGINLELLWENMKPDYRDGEDFAHIFAIYFPAVTGILAGANISGNLKDPGKAIPKGTILAVLLTTLTYLVFAWIAGITVMREASGLPSNQTNATFYELLASNTEYCKENKCKYGLLNDYDAIGLVSFISPIIIAGIFSASLSSALASLVSAPKIFQAVGKDRIFPKIEYFAVGYGQDKEPW